MASKETWKAVSVTLMIVAAASFGLWARTQWGNENRTCWSGDQAYPCSEIENAAADMAAHAMGDLILAYLFALLIAAAITGYLGLRPTASTHGTP